MEFSSDLYFKNQLFALKYTLKHSLFKIKLISTITCFGPIRPSSGIGPKHVVVLINLILKSECFKVYFSAKSWFFKYKSGILHGRKMKSSSVVLKCGAR